MSGVCLKVCPFDFIFPNSILHTHFLYASNVFFNVDFIFLKKTYFLTTFENYIKPNDFLSLFVVY